MSCSQILLGGLNHSWNWWAASFAPRAHYASSTMGPNCPTILPMKSMAKLANTLVTLSPRGRRQEKSKWISWVSAAGLYQVYSELWVRCLFLSFDPCYLFDCEDWVALCISALSICLYLYRYPYPFKCHPISELTTPLLVKRWPSPAPNFCA